MTRAEERAFKTYPFNQRSAATPFGTITFDQHAESREAYIKGYRQAEGDTLHRACLWILNNVDEGAQIINIQDFIMAFQKGVEMEDNEQ